MRVNIDVLCRLTEKARLVHAQGKMLASIAVNYGSKNFIDILDCRLAKKIEKGRTIKNNNYIIFN